MSSPPISASGAPRSWSPVLRAIAARRSVILGYHGVQDVPRASDPLRLQVPPATFRSQLQAMRQAGFCFTTVAELARRGAGGAPPPGLAAVSFDDGLRNNLTIAAPILRELEIPASVYVVSSWLGGRNPWIADAGGNELLEAGEVRELAALGWEIGAHTVTHPDLTRLSPAGCEREVADSVAAIGSLIGERVRTFAYPFGSYDSAAVEAVKLAGLEAALTIGSGRWDRFELTRAMISAGEPAPVSALKLLDAYEPLLGIPPLPQLRRASKRRRGGGPESVRSDGA